MILAYVVNILINESRIFSNRALKISTYHKVVTGRAFSNEVHPNILLKD